MYMHEEPRAVIDVCVLTHMHGSSIGHLALGPKRPVALRRPGSVSFTGALGGALGIFWPPCQIWFPGCFAELAGDGASATSFRHGSKGQD